MTDVQILLANLPNPILWVIPQGGMTVELVDGLITAVETSAERWVDSSVLGSVRTRDLLTDRMEMDGGRLVKKVIEFRHYLRVTVPKHRRALTHIVLSCHFLAMERLRWRKRHIYPVPGAFRHCLPACASGRAPS